MNRRTAHATTKTPARTGGEDRPRLPCEPYANVYDTLSESGRGDSRAAHDEALEAARNMCGTCLLRNPDTARACLDGALDRGERWARAVLGRSLSEAVPPPNGRSHNAAWLADKNAAREADLEALARADASVEEACEVLKVKRDGLYTWCARHGRLDLWRAISPGTPQAPLSYPRRRKGVAA